MKITTNICKLIRFIILSKKGIVFGGKTSAGLTIHWLDIFKFVGQKHITQYKCLHYHTDAHKSIHHNQTKTLPKFFNNKLFFVLEAA